MAFDTLKNLGIDSPYKERYDNFIGGKWVKPVDGKYFENITPLTGSHSVKLLDRQKQMLT